VMAAGVLVVGMSLSGAPAVAQDVTWTGEGPLAAEADPEFQQFAALAPTPWLVAKQSAGIAYFVFESPAHIERYDLVGEEWLDPIALSAVPTAFHVDADGLYLGFGTAVSRLTLDGTSETHLLDTLFVVHDLVTLDGYLYGQDTYAFFSVDKETDEVISYGFFAYVLGGMSTAPGQNKIFGRTTTTGPSDIIFFVMEHGSLVSLQDSPYHGDYPSAQKTWIYPGEALVVDNSGIVYHTDDLAYAGSLAGFFEDVAFHGTNAIVLRDGMLIAYGEDFLRVGQYAPATAPSGIFIEGDSIFAFSWDGMQMAVEKISIDAFSLPGPGAPVDPHGLAYIPDQMIFDGTDVLYLLHRGSRGVFRWSMEARDYQATIPLVEEPVYMALSTVNGVFYFTHGGGEITETPLATLEESPLVNSPQTPCGLAAAEEYIFVCDPSGGWVSHFTYGPDGALVTQRDLNYFSEEYRWSAANRRMYFLRDHTSPNDLLWEQIAPDGFLGSEGETPYHSSEGILHPIRVAPDGSVVVLGSGRIYDALSLVQVDTLSNDISDAAWISGTLFTLRPWGEQSQVQTWGAGYAVDATRELPGTPLGLFTDGDRLLVATLVGGVPELTILDRNLEAPGFLIRKTDGLDFVSPGQAVQYRIEVVNVSSSTITGALVEDVTPPELTNVTWTCAASPGSTCAGGLQAGNVSDVVEVQAGDMLVYTVWAEVAPGTPDSLLTNVATVQEPAGATSRATDRTTVREGLIFTDYFESGDLSLWIDHGD